MCLPVSSSTVNRSAHGAHKLQEENSIASARAVHVSQYLNLNIPTMLKKEEEELVFILLFTYRSLDSVSSSYIQMSPG